MAKVVRIDDSGFIWDAPAEAIAKHRAEYYAKRDKNTTYDEEFAFAMEDEGELLDWFHNNMDWEDIEADAKFICAPSPLKKPRLNTDHCKTDVIET